MTAATTVGTGDVSTIALVASNVWHVSPYRCTPSTSTRLYGVAASDVLHSKAPLHERSLGGSGWR